MFAVTFLLGAPIATAAFMNPAPAMATALTQTAREVPEGVWGGAHVLMEITAAGAALTYECAHGTIDQGLELDGKGHFDVRGTHTRERGGPVRSGETPDRDTARYTGRVDGKIMTLVVTLTDTKETVGTFSLTFGERPELHRCA
jgi:hypothetical protein